MGYSDMLLKRFSRNYLECLFVVETQHSLHRDKLTRSTMPLDAMLTQLPSFRFLALACRNGMVIGSD